MACSSMQPHRAVPSSSCLPRGGFSHGGRPGSTRGRHTSRGYSGFPVPLWDRAIGCDFTSNRRCSRLYGNRFTCDNKLICSFKEGADPGFQKGGVLNFLKARAKLQGEVSSVYLH